MGFKFKPINLKIKGYDYDKLYYETSDEDYDDYDDNEEEYIDLSGISPKESDGEVKEGKGLKILTHILITYLKCGFSFFYIQAFVLYQGLFNETPSLLHIRVILLSLIGCNFYGTPANTLYFLKRYISQKSDTRFLNNSKHVIFQRKI